MTYSSDELILAVVDPKTKQRSMIRSKHPNYEGSAIVGIDDPFRIFWLAFPSDIFTLDAFYVDLTKKIINKAPIKKNIKLLKMLSPGLYIYIKHHGRKDTGPNIYYGKTDAERYAEIAVFDTSMNEKSLKKIYFEVGDKMITDYLAASKSGTHITFVSYDPTGKRSLHVITMQGGK